jgi:hypothetical protein
VSGDAAGVAAGKATARRNAWNAADVGEAFQTPPRTAKPTRGPTFASTALRGWPLREIERRVRLSRPQRAALYELVSSSLKVADTLADACPADTALTKFYEALDQGQKVNFAGMR